MNIAIVTPGYLPVPDVLGGAVEALTTFIVKENEKSDNALNIELFTIYNEQLNGVRFKNTNICQVKRLFVHRVIYHFLCKFGMNRNFYYDKIIKRLKNNKFDAVIVENNIDLLLSIVRSGVINESILIYHFHNDIDTLEYTADKFKILSKKNIPVIAVSQYVKDHIIRLIPEMQVYTLQNAVDLDKFRPELYDGKEIRYRYGIDDDEIVFMYSGRIVEYKGILELIKSFNMVVKNGYDNIRLLVVGSFNNYAGEDDEYTKRIKKEASETGDRVIFTGFVPYRNVAKYYAAADAVVVATWMEAAGLVNIEARAMGKALIASNVGGIPEYTNDDCILVDKDESFVDNIVVSIEKVLEAPGLMESMKKGGRRGIDEYSTKRYYTNFRMLIGNLCDEKRKRLK